MVKFIGLLLLTLTIVTIAFLGLFMLPPFARKLIDKKIALNNGSLIYPIWKDFPIPVYHRFYFYNVTNPDLVEKLGHKPDLVEVGPFTYKVNIHKKPLWRNDNGTLSFREIRSWHFVESLSVAGEDTIITTINGPLVTTLSLLGKTSPAVRKIIDTLLETLTHGFFIERSIKELTFEGYADLLITYGPLIAPEATKNYNGKFGYFYPKNDTDDGLYTVHSGVGVDVQRINLLTRIDGQDSLKLWTSQECNQFNDTTLGEIFPPMRAGPTAKLKIYTSDLCRTFTLHYKKSHSVFRGLETWRYLLSSDTFNNGKDFPPNECFTSYLPSRSFDGINGTDLPSGVYDASKCKYGFPIFMSSPHFLNADPYYASMVNGMEPNASLHDTWFEIEPTSGSTTSTSVKLQLNLGIIDSHLFNRAHRMPNIVFPVFWMDFSLQLTPDLIDHLIFANTVLNFVPTLIFHIGIAVAGLLLFIASLKLIIPKRRENIHGFLSVITCNRDKDIKDDEQRILDSEEYVDTENSANSNNNTS